MGLVQNQEPLLLESLLQKAGVDCNLITVKHNSSMKSSCQLRPSICYLSLRLWVVPLTDFSHLRISDRFKDVPKIKKRFILDGMVWNIKRQRPSNVHADNIEPPAGLIVISKEVGAETSCDFNSLHFFPSVACAHLFFYHVWKSPYLNLAFGSSTAVTKPKPSMN